MLKAVLWLYLAHLVLVSCSWDGPIVTVEKEEKIPTVAENHDEVNQNRVDVAVTHDAPESSTMQREVSLTLIPVMYIVMCILQ
ncbi:unnamed protein product [Bursaphelenchus okinawaensis]|uniref:Uncharacterized protein n=1 Tax=Bursaphelenchus okinawaensis TaxID=465554 RepID=A0A811K6Q4_9BILA|nr:unnamed protein product [Bursaphelenchus okinawaensis]CAG9092589.1 unnamed protein product [Bursaphelenchus okinawaensis]